MTAMSSHEFLSELLVGKSVTDGEPGPQIGKVTSARSIGGGIEVMIRIDDLQFSKALTSKIRSHLTLGYVDEIGYEDLAGS